MELYKPSKNSATIYILFMIIMTSVFTGILIYLVNSYVVVSLLKVALVAINLYLIYYLAVGLTLQYKIDGDYLIISRLWGMRNIRISFKSIEGYDTREGNIRGVKLSGVGNDKFAFGRTIIDKIGTTHMFVTSNSRTFYLKTADITYAVSPGNFDEFEKELQDRNIDKKIEQYQPNRNINLYKDKTFFIPFIFVSIVIIILTLNPFILYLKNLLPGTMPLHFDATFFPVTYGTGKQFAFKQMTYGVLNMIILLCMYYASYFCAKYDRKSAYKYIYVSLISSVVFLLIQLRILVEFS